jgi:hypothetical protein
MILSHFDPAEIDLRDLVNRDREIGWLRDLLSE